MRPPTIRYWTMPLAPDSSRANCSSRWSHAAAIDPQTAIQGGPSGSQLPKSIHNRGGREWLLKHGSLEALSGRRSDRNEGAPQS